MATTPPRRPKGPAPTGAGAATRRAAGRRGGRSSSLAWVVGIAVVVLIGVVAIIASRGGDDEGGVATTAEVQVDGSPLAPLPDNGADPAVGQPVPTLSGSGMDGGDLTVGGGGGTPKAIFVVAHWCPHCQAEVPRIVDWVESGSVPDGVDLQAVSTAVDATRGNYPPAAWLEEEGWEIPTLVDSADSVGASALGTSAFPFFVFVDGDGNLQGRTSGEIAIDELQTTLEQLAAAG